MSLIKSSKKIVVTGGGGFIGGALVRKLLNYSKAKIFNLDKLGYASDLSGIEETLEKINNREDRYKFFKIDISKAKKTKSLLKQIDPDLIFHLAAETNVDNSIISPKEFVQSNIIGTFNLLEASYEHYKSLSAKRKEKFFFHHISTDEVFGSLHNDGFFNEASPYSPNNPYAATKASSDHLVRSWYKTFGLPIKITNCSNNYGPWQNKEKLISKTILNCLKFKKIPIYGNGNNIRDWLFIEDHIEALITVAERGNIGSTYCIGGNNEMSNLEVIQKICSFFDEIIPSKAPHNKLFEFVQDRLGHDYRYAIDSSKIKNELNWSSKYSLKEGLKLTILWFLEKYSNDNLSTKL